MDDLLRKLRQEILFARQRVYHADQPTPLQSLPVPGAGPVFLKREDLSAIKAYKWRGAYNRLAIFSQTHPQVPIVTASAGNHAQGVARAARLLGATARVYMPHSTPQVKQEAVTHHGGKSVEVVLAGESYDEAYEEARRHQEEQRSLYLHAYDDLQVIAGQATLADEVVLSGQGPFDVAFLQIGGGGMAAGVATWLRLFYPEIEIVGVEGEGQASMAAAVQAGSPVRLNHLDLFCDGTAVRQAGEIPFQVCRHLVDRFVTVSNEEVSLAIRFLWETQRCLLEPSGAMGVAALLQQLPKLQNRRSLVIGCGANLDFGQLAIISERSGVGPGQRRLLQITIPERPGAMVELLQTGLGNYNIIDFQYGITSSEKAQPIFGISADELTLQPLLTELSARGFPNQEVSHTPAARFRAITCNARFIAHPLFLELDFYERRGALQTFLEQTIRNQGNLVYFNYRYSGERIGRALIGIDFQSPAERDAFLSQLPRSGPGYRTCTPLSASEASALLGSPGPRH
ncbi:MAG: pyridoxal-phosphate dependent enzyme [Puniceicoccaceae bacterium]